MRRWNRRLSDQALVLDAVRSVRGELVARCERGAKTDSMEIMGVMQRLCALYSCLDIDKILAIVEAADTRKEYEKSVVVVEKKEVA
jgi:hypothetical protein